MVAVRVPLLLLVPVLVEPDARGRRADARHQHHLRRRAGSSATSRCAAGSAGCAPGRRSGRCARMAAVSAVAGAVGWLVLNVTDDLFGTSAAGSLGTVLVGTVVIGGVALAGLVVARVPEIREPLAARQGPEGTRMTGSSQDAPPPPERSRRRPVQDRGSTVSMTSTTTGLPDRYRPARPGRARTSPPPTGVIRCWRAKDRVLNRDVAIRVHTPAGPAAHAWISRALTAGGLATPALAMVYDASEGTGDPQTPGGAAYVVNEWIDGETLAERLSRGPMPDREVRTVLRRLAEGVAEAHRVGPGRRRPDPRERRAAAQRAGRPAGRPRRHRHHRRRHRRAGRPARGLPHRPGARPRPARPLTGPSDLWPSSAAPAPPSPARACPASPPWPPCSPSAPRTGPGAVDRPAPHRAAPRRHRQRLAAPAARAPAATPPPSRRPPTDGEAVRLDPQTLPPVPPVRPVTQPTPRSRRPPSAATPSTPAPSRPRRRLRRRRRSPRPPARRPQRVLDRPTTSRSASSPTTTATAATAARRPARPTSTTTRTAPAGTASSSSACRCSPCSWSSRWPGGSARPCST